MKSKNEKIELSRRDREFAFKISESFEIPLKIMTTYLKDMIRHSSRIEPYPIDKIDYKVTLPMKQALKESIEIKTQATIFLYYIYCHWKIPKYHKCIISAYVLMHYKLDKYSRILDSDEIVSRGYSADDYNHYLYDRIRSRFRRFKSENNLTP
jgi:hypothetical protein